MRRGAIVSLPEVELVTGSFVIANPSLSKAAPWLCADIMDRINVFARTRHHIKPLTAMPQVLKVQQQGTIDYAVNEGSIMMTCSF